MIRLRTWPAVPKQIRTAVRRAIKLLPEVTEINHAIRVALIPAYFWIDESGRSVMGHFREPFSGCDPKIIICGLVWDRDAQAPADGHRAIGVVLDTLLHEIGHYEQMRDGKKCVERGIGKRVMELAQALTKKGME